MPLIDDRGRLFGKVNVIDVLVGLLVFGLIPLVYGAFLLFRVPAPKITSITPTEVLEHQPATLQITGEDLRPFLHALLGTHEAEAFLIQSPARAEIKLPDLAAGSYDLVLFDEAQELLRMPGALTVVAPPLPPPLPVTEFQVVGRFVDLAVDAAPSIRPGLKLGHGEEDEPLAEVLAVRSPEASVYNVKVGSETLAAPKPGRVTVPAIIRARCAIAGDGCTVEGVALAPGSTVLLPLLAAPGKDGEDRSSPSQVSFVLEEVRPVDARLEFPSDRPTLPRVELQAVGDFALPVDDVPSIQPGLRLGRSEDELFAEVLAVRSPELGVRRLRVGSSVISVPKRGAARVPAIIRLSCEVADDACRVGNVVVAQDATVTFPWADGFAHEGEESLERQLSFAIAGVRSVDSPVEFPSSLIDVQVVGRFIELSKSDAGQFRVGLKFEGRRDEPSAEVLAVQEPVAATQRVRTGLNTQISTPVSGEFAVPAIVRLSCVITPDEACMVGKTSVIPNATIRLPAEAGADQVGLFIDEVWPADSRLEFPSIRKAVATLRVRFLARPEVVGLVKVGDVDVGDPMPVTDEDRASLTSLESERQTTTARAFVDAGVSSNFQFEETVVAFNATLEVPVVLTPSGWRYRDKPVKVGASFSFETMSGFMDGWILNVNVDPKTERVVR